MNPKLLLCFACFTFVLPSALRADDCNYDSVEWLTAMADRIGVYQVERIYGPHSVTNDAQQWSCCSCTADFKLLRALREDPEATFSRTRAVDKPEGLGFQAGDTYIFFLVSDDRPPERMEPPSEIFFSTWDYIWLERPPGERNGVAIDHRGMILTNQADIVKLVEASLKLPRASPGIDRWTYSMYPHGTNFNFRVVTFPVAGTFVGERWAYDRFSPMELVIPECLYVGGAAGTNQSDNPAAAKR